MIYLSSFFFFSLWWFDNDHTCQPVHPENGAFKIYCSSNSSSLLYVKASRLRFGLTGATKYFLNKSIQIFLSFSTQDYHYDNFLSGVSWCGGGCLWLSRATPWQPCHGQNYFLKEIIILDNINIRVAESVESPLRALAAIFSGS